jgi:putative drug exporter of the RND superfamily
MFDRLGSWTFRFRFLIIAAWIIGGVLCAKFAPSLAGSGSTDQASFLPPNAPSVIARDHMEKAFPGSTSSSSATITMDRPGGLTDADRAWRDAFTAWTTSADAPEGLRKAVTSTETADSRPELESMLRSDDGTFETFVVNLNTTTAGDATAAVVKSLRERLTATIPAGLESHVTGSAAISSDYLDAVKAGTDSTTAVTVILVLVVLLLIYRAPLAALVPLVTIGLSFVVSRGVLGLLAALGWQVSSLLDTFLVVMVFGVGTDYAIFMISRYREEVSGGEDWHDAVRTTVARIGAVIAASAATVIVGMASMAFGDFKMISTTGPAIAVAIFVTLIAGLTLAPALLAIFGHYLFWPLHTRPKPEGEPGGFFARLASVVSHRPVLVTVLLTGTLIVPILFLPQVKTNFDVLSELPPTADSRIGYEQLGDHLGEDKLVQSQGLVAAGGGVDITEPAQLAKLRDLLADLKQTEGVSTVTSLVTPDGDGVVPDGFRPSVQLADIGDGFKGDSGTKKDTSSSALLDPDVRDGLNKALDYVNGLGVAFPDIAAGTEMRDVTGGLGHAIDIVDRVKKNAVLSTQLRTLASSITAPSAAAGSSDNQSDEDKHMMSNYLAELGTAYPEVKTLDAYKDGVKAAAGLAKDATVGDALDLSDAFNRLATHFDATPDATLTPKALANTAAAKELKREAEDTFNGLPGQFAALAAVFSPRSDDIYLPTNLTGEDADKLNDAIDAFVSKDRTATRFYVTNANDPYSGGAFVVLRNAQARLADGAGTFGPSATATIGGPTAQFADVQTTLENDFGRVGIATVIGIFVVLVLLLRALVAPLYLVATVLVSYGSAVGVSAFLFQDVMGHAGISFYLPLMVFVLLVALGSDYNIFLMSRVREEAEGRTIKDGIRLASGYTGAVITSAGLILAGTFGSMATAPLIVLFQVGVAVAIGVLIDTFVVRSILVPAITTVFGDRAWWPSGALVGAVVSRVPLVPAGAGAGAAALAAGAARVRASRTKVAVALALAVLVPVTVAGLLTWSLGSSAGNLGSVRAAVVNQDEGGSVTSGDGTVSALALGSDLSTALTTGGEGRFTWVTQDAAAAESGLADGTYAAVLTIPADFSRTVAAIRADTTGSAPQATLRLVTNDGSGYALGTVAREVTAAIGASTAQGVTSSYVDDVLLAVTSAHDALAAAADDAASVSTSSTKLADNAAGTKAVAAQLVGGLQEFVDQADSTASGTTKLIDGTAQLADGAEKLASGARKLASGAGDAATGAAKLASGARQMASGLATLESKTKDLPSGAQQLATGAAGVSTGVNGVASGASQLAAGLDTMAQQTNGLGAQGSQLDAAAGQIASGASDVSSGVSQSATGAAGLETGATQLAGGVAGFTGGVSGLAATCGASGADPAFCAQLAGLAGQGPALATAAGDLATGATQLSHGLDQLRPGAHDLASGAAQLSDGVHQLAGSLPALEHGIARSASGADDLATGATALKAGAAQLADGTAQFSAGMPALADGISKSATGGAGIASGAADLAKGLKTLAGGTSSLADGASQTATGARKLADGTADAGSGMDDLTSAVQTALDAGTLVQTQVQNLADDGLSLSDEADSLKTTLTDKADTTATYPAEARPKIGSLAANPVAVDATRVNAVTGPEGGLAPFLMAMAAWLGALGAFLVLPGLWRSDDRSWWRAMLQAFAGAAGVAIGGALLMVLGLRFLLGMGVADLPGLLLFATLAAVAFTAVVQALVALFGNRGWLVALLFLVVQVAASGVGLTAAATPGPLAAIHPFVPLSYAIDAFQGAIAGGGSSPTVDAIVLVAWAFAASLVTLAFAAGLGRRESEEAEAQAG